MLPFAGLERSPFFALILVIGSTQIAGYFKSLHQPLSLQWPKCLI